MSGEEKPQNNYDRLLKHLKHGSLAASLVQAHRNSDADEPTKSMKAVLSERIAQMRQKIGNPKT
jgi:hypothetical protein